MESLRRLTSSVLSGNSSAAASTDPASALDLTFITDQLIVSGFPVTTATNRKANEVNVDELAQYLETHHSNHYLVFNLDSLGDDNSNNAGASTSSTLAPGNDNNSNSSSLLGQLWKRTPQPAAFNTHTSTSTAQTIALELREQIVEFSWTRDGMNAHTPPLDLVYRLCYALNAWLALHTRNVAVVHCTSGKTRSGIVVACFLLFARLAADPLGAFALFYRKRWAMQALTSDALRTKTPPSIQRFLMQFHTLAVRTDQTPLNDRPLRLKAIVMRALPVDIRPCVQIWDDHRLVFSTDDRSTTAKDVPMLDWNSDDGFLAILWESDGIELDGGFSIVCSFGTELEDEEEEEESDAHARVLFRYSDSTWFLSPGLVTLAKAHVDLQKQYDHGFDAAQFSMDLVLHEAPPPLPLRCGDAGRENRHVRLDYTGIDAVRQGIVELTSHHVVLPDPAMHATFCRMGFSDIPTTFALQRSQNTPNVALDLLHSESLRACFASQNVPQSVSDSVSDSDSGKDVRPLRPPVVEAESPLQRRQTTAEIVALQSQRTAVASSASMANSVVVCRICCTDDYMLRPQLVTCTIANCGSVYHTMCVGLRKIPFGLTTLSDRTNHDVYKRKFFSNWACNACVPPASVTVASASLREAASKKSATAPTAWTSSNSAVLRGNEQQQQQQPPSRGVTRDAAAVGSVTTSSDSSEAAKLHQLRAFLVTSGVSIDDLLHAATTANVAIAASVMLNDSNSNSSNSNSNSNAQAMGDGAFEATGAAAVEEDVVIDRSDNVTRPPDRLNAFSSNAIEDLEFTALHVSDDDTAAAAAAAAAAAVPSANKIVIASLVRARNELLEQIAARTAAVAAAVPVAVADSTTELLQSHAEKRTQQHDDSINDSRTAHGATTSAVATSHADRPSDTPLGSLDDALPVSKYTRMLQLGVPFAAVQNCMVKDAVDPLTLQPLADKAAVSIASSAPQAPTADTQLRLRDVEAFAKYFHMLRLGCPKGAVKHKLVMDGLDPQVVDFGPDAVYDNVQHLVAAALPTATRSRLQDDIQCVRAPRNSNNSSDCAATIDAARTAAARPTPLPVVASDAVRLQDDPTYATYFRMRKMGLPDDAVRHKMRADGNDERALDLGGDVFVAALTALSQTTESQQRLGDDPAFAKYFRMLQMGLPDGAVRHKMVTDNVDVRALDLGADASVAALHALIGKANSTDVKRQLPTPTKPRRKKLHWQAISNDRLSSLNHATIWEDDPSGDADVTFDVDMDEIESLFFATSDATTTTSKKKANKALQRKQRVTLVDAKRAMNAAISLARVKLSYDAIATAVETFDASGLSLEQLVGISEFLPTPEEMGVVTAYAGDVAALGEAEKFMLSMARVERCAERMESLVFTLAFPLRQAELVASYRNIQLACTQVKTSRLLKVLLSIVLKLGNTLNGSSSDDSSSSSIRGFTVDSLLRLGTTKAVNQKTTVLHYLVRVIKKNYPHVLDFQQELECVPLAARESFEAIADDFAKLQTGHTKLTIEVHVLERMRATDDRIDATVRAMHVAVLDIEAQIALLHEAIASVRADVTSVFDYFGEDPQKNPTAFFATLTSFCLAFDAARKEVDAADEVAQRAERLKLRRSNSVTPRAQRIINTTTTRGTDAAPRGAGVSKPTTPTSGDTFQRRRRSDRTSTTNEPGGAVLARRPSLPSSAAGGGAE